MVTFLLSHAEPRCLKCCNTGSVAESPAGIRLGTIGLGVEGHHGFGSKTGGQSGWDGLFAGEDPPVATGTGWTGHPKGPGLCQVVAC